MLRFFSLISLGFLAACASQIMEGYVGKPISEAVLDYGPPTNIVELGKDKRAYQWSRVNSGVVPITSPTTTNIYGSGGYATAYTTSTTYVPYANQCVYTLLATRQGQDWIVEGFRKPTLECE